MIRPAPLSLQAARELAASLACAGLSTQVRTVTSHRGLVVGELVFVGGRYGDHVLSLPDTDEARVLAHWSGYLRVNGAAPPAPVIPVAAVREAFEGLAL